MSKTDCSNTDDWEDKNSPKAEPKFALIIETFFMFLAAKYKWLSW